jgi:hypothetical protein
VKMLILKGSLCFVGIINTTDVVSGVRKQRLALYIGTTK